MPDAVFDTTVLIDYYRGISAAGGLVTSAREGTLVAWCSPITVYELWLRPMEREEETFYLSLLFTARELPFTRTAARQVGVWLRTATRQQRLALAADAMIAASAAERNLTIYTRNPRDFTRFYTDVQAY
jgi:predicted nucleic acid-binding protein